MIELFWPKLSLLKWLQKGLNQTFACRAELALSAETDLFNFK